MSSWLDSHEIYSFRFQTLLENTEHFLYNILNENAPNFSQSLNEMGFRNFHL